MGLNCSLKIYSEAEAHHLHWLDSHPIWVTGGASPTPFWRNSNGTDILMNDAANDAIITAGYIQRSFIGTINLGNCIE